MAKQKNPEMKRLIDQLLKAYGIKSRVDALDALKYWEDLVGNGIVRHITKCYVSNKVLYTHLDSSVVRQELSYVKDELLQKIQHKFGKELILDIVLR